MSNNQIIMSMLIFLCIILFLYFSKTLKFLVKIIFKILLGVVVLSVTNYLLTPFNLNVGINVITAAISGFLGIPGILCLYILKLLL